MQNGLSEWRMLQVRTGGAFVLLFIYVLLTNYKSLKVKLNEWPLLVAYSFIGYALVQFGYFIAISRMHVSMALIIEFTAPIWIVLWIKYVRKSFVPKDMWIAISLAFVGMLLLAQVWDGMTLDTLGVIAAFLDAFALATFYPQRKTHANSFYIFSDRVWLWNLHRNLGNRISHLDIPI
jgi:drug/metabolite transporter (DMT)-like permease